MNESQKSKDARPKVGIVAIICNDNHFLVIKRSQFVRAPGFYCFPGGGQEPNETEPQTLVREIREELNVGSNPVQCVWESVSQWGVQLRWWTATLRDSHCIVPNPREVEWAGWLTLDQFALCDPVLSSNLEFVNELRRGAIRL